MRGGGTKGVGDAGKGRIDTLAQEAARIFSAATRGLAPKAVSTVSDPPVGFNHADNGFKRFASAGNVNASRFAAKAAQVAQDRATVLAGHIMNLPLSLGGKVLQLLITHGKKS